MTSRTEPDGTANWTWGSSVAAHNVGRLISVAGPSYSESYTYDGLSRLSNRTIVSDATYAFDVSYNALGAPDTLTYPTSTAGVRFKVKYAYTGGVLSSIQDYTGNVNGTVLWNLNLLDAAGHPVSETYGNGLWLQNAFDPLTGEAKTRQAGTGGQASNVQNLAYAWDKAGNLSNRQDLRQGLIESFTYDALDRLTNASGPGSQSLTLAYDAIGNVTSRTDVGSFTYDPVRRHAVTAAGPNSYAYDANGNMTTRNGATILWTSANLPSSLNASGFNGFFAYAPDRSRWRQVASYTGGSETTTYVGGLLEVLTTSIRTHWKHRVFTPSGEVQVIRRNDATSDVYYVTTDHLGSTDTVMDAAASILARESFGAWGARRSSNWQGSPSPGEWQSIANTTRRGYTGHEELDNILLVHMNGRVYDPAIGRFLAADPYIDGAESSQGWNRYAYVQNRPTASSDPTGFEHLPWGIKDVAVDINGASNSGASVGSGAGSGSGGALENIVVTSTWLYWNWALQSIQELQARPIQLVSRDGGGGGGGGGDGDGGDHRLPCSAASEDPQGDNDILIELQFTAAGPLLEWAAPYVNHTLVTATDPVSGSTFAVRSGPGSGPGGPGYGPLHNTSVAGYYGPAFPDFNSSYAAQTVGYVNASFADVRAYMQASADAISNRWNPYLGVTMNSNSTSGMVLEGMGFNNVSPMLPAPGFDAPLLIGPPLKCVK